MLFKSIYLEVEKDGGVSPTCPFYLLRSKSGLVMSEKDNQADRHFEKIVSSAFRTILSLLKEVSL
jgi:hypothetical protein